MRTIGKVGVRAALLVVLALAWAVPTARADALPPTGVGPVDDVVDQVDDALPDLPPPPVEIPAPPSLPLPDLGTPPSGLPAPPSGVPSVPPAGGGGLPSGDAPDLGGLPAPDGVPDLGGVPDFSDLPALCGFGSGVPDAEIVDCILTTLLGPDYGDTPDLPDAVCDLNDQLGGLLDPLCPDDPDGPGGPAGPGSGGGSGGGTAGTGEVSDPGSSYGGPMLARTGGSVAAALIGLLLVTGGVLVLRARRLAVPA